MHIEKAVYLVKLTTNDGAPVISNLQPWLLLNQMKTNMNTDSGFM